MKRTYGLAHIKSNYDTLGPTLNYRMESVNVPKLGRDQYHARIEWLGIAKNLTANQMLAPETDMKPREKGKVFLQRFLADGPRDRGHIISAAKEKGISERTLDRAKNDLGIETEEEVKRGKQGKFGEQVTWWSLPPRQR